MKDILLHLPNKGLKGLESFLLVFLCTYINMAFCFYIYGSLQVLSCDPGHSFDVVELRKVQIKKIVYPLGHHQTLVLDRHGSLIILGSAFSPLFSQKKM